MKCIQNLLEAVAPTPPQVPSLAKQAMEAMRNPRRLKSPVWQNQQLQAVRQMTPPEQRAIPANPDILRFERRFVRECAGYGIPVFASEVWRGRDRQNKLLREGFSRAAFGQSAHNYGCAVDLVHSSSGWELSTLQWAMLGQIGFEVARKLNIEVNWGGDETALWGDFTNPDDRWRWDPAHWEIANWRQLKANGMAVLAS